LKPIIIYQNNPLFSGRKDQNLLTPSSTGHQTNFFGTDLLLQLDPRDPLLRLAQVIPWPELDRAFAKHYTQGQGRPSKPIRLMVGLLILKQLDNLSDEQVVLSCKRNPYYQSFCGLTEFSNKLPCDSTELVHFRKRIGTEGVDRLFQFSVKLHGKAALEATVNIDTTVQEKNITYRTDAKLAIKIINRPDKLAKHGGIQQRRTYSKEVKALCLNLQHFRHVKRRAKAKKALKRLRTIAHALIPKSCAGACPRLTCLNAMRKTSCFTKGCWVSNNRTKTKSTRCTNPPSIASARAKTINNMSTATKCPLPPPPSPTSSSVYPKGINRQPCAQPA
jgi:Transposase domain (DUF772)